MNIDLIPTLIDQLRETMESATGASWITDGSPEGSFFGTIDPLTPAQAFAAPSPGGKSIAAHVEHLRFTLDVTAERLAGKDPQPDWAKSFTITDTSSAAWETLKAELRRAYQATLTGFNQYRDRPLQDWPPVFVAGLSGAIAHNAYHLGSIRQMAKVVAASK